MSKIFTHPHSFTAKLAFVGSYGACFSCSLGFLIETMSNIQIFHIILATSFPPDDDNKTLIFHQIRDLTSFVGLFDILTKFEKEIFTLITWFALCSYLLGILLFTIHIAWLNAKSISINRIKLQIFTSINIIHSKVLFCPIHFFYLKFISSQKICSSAQPQPCICANSLTILTIVFLSANLFFAALKETLFYQVYKNKNAFAVKTNFHSLLQLSHKALLFPLLILVDPDLITNSILNVVFTLVYHILLFVKLPHHNIKSLRFAIFLSSICSTSSFVLLWKIFTKPRIKTFELLVILITPVLTKFMLDRLSDLFERILTFKAKSPDHVVLLPTLVKEYIFTPSGVDHGKKLGYKTIYTFGIVKMNNLDVSAMKDSSQLKDYKQKIHDIILGEVLKCYQRNPKSLTVLLFLVQFCLQKMKNISLAVRYIQKIQELPISSPIANALVCVKNQLSQILFRAYSDYDKSLTFVSYFKYKEISTTLKSNIQAEVKEHIEFWKILSKEKVDVYKALQISKSLDILALNNQKAWQEYEVDFIKNFPVPLIMYGIYLSVVRGMPHHGQSLLDRSVGKNSKLMKSMEDWFSQERALIVASNQKGTIGKVLDASYSVKNIFNIEKQDLIGRKINMLMPRMIQEKHDEIIQRYNEKPTCNVSLNKPVYCKTADGRFFLSNFRLRVYPYIDKGIGLIGIFNKKEKCVPVFFLDVDGTIVDCSRELINMSSPEFFSSQRIKIQELAPEFDRINTAFNQVYLPKVQESRASIASIGSQPVNDNQIDVIASVIEPIKTSKQTYHMTNKTSIAFETSPFILDLPSSARRIAGAESSRNLEPVPLIFPVQRDRESSKLDLFSNSEENPVSLSKQEGTVSPHAPRIVDTATGLVEPLPRSKLRFSQDDSTIARSQNGGELNEANRICQRFEKGSAILFRFQQGSKFYSNGFDYFFIKVEPFFFDNKLYKIVRIKKVKKSRNPGTPRWSPNSKGSQLEVLNLEEDCFMPIGAIRSEDSQAQMSKRISDSEANSSVSRKAFENVLNSVSNHHSLAPNHTEQGIKQEFTKGKKCQGNKQDRSRIEKALYKLYEKENTSRFIKAYTGLFYLGMILMTTFIVINYLSTKGSFQQVSLSAQLVSLNGERITNLVNIWGSANVIYSYVGRGKPVSPVFQGMYANTQTMIKRNHQLGREVMLLLPLVDSHQVYDEFFRKNVYVWNPGDPVELVAPSPFDSFLGSKLVLQHHEIVNTEEFGSLRRSDTNLVIYTLNNTVNDLLLSLELEMQATQAFKKDVYAYNIVVLKVLIFIEGVVIFVVLFSLVLLFIQIIKSYRRLFGSISTIPYRNIEVRDKQLIRFKEFLQESVESLKFIQDLNDFFEKFNQAKERNSAKGIAFKDESKYHYGRVKSVGLMFIFLALVNFLSIFGLFYLSNHLSSEANRTLQTIDEGSQTAQIVGYQIYLLSGNFIYWANLRNKTDLLIRNEPLEEQLNKNMEFLQDVNNLLVSALSNEYGEFNDKDVENLFMNDVCSYISQAISYQNLCRTATKGKVLGLFAINMQLYELISTYIEKYKEDHSLEEDDKLINDYLLLSASHVITLDSAYKFLKARLVKVFDQDFEDQETSSMIMLILICVSCGVVTVVVRFIVLRQFKILEKLKYKVLKLVPQNMVVENKVILTYLKQEFSHDLADVKSIM